MSNSQWHEDQSAPYRQAAAMAPNPTGHPVVDQTAGPVLDPGCNVSVYKKWSDGSWQGVERIVVRCSTTHLESMGPVLKERDITIVEWGAVNRWLAA